MARRTNVLANTLASLLIVLVLAMGVGMAYKLTGGFTGGFKSYSVEVNGKLVTSKTVIAASESATIVVRNVLNEATDFTLEVYTNSDETHTLKYLDANNELCDIADVDLTSAARLTQEDKSITVYPIALNSALLSLYDNSISADFETLDYTYSWLKLVIKAKDFSISIPMQSYIGVEQITLPPDGIIL